MVFKSVLDVLNWFYVGDGLALCIQRMSCRIAFIHNPHNARVPEASIPPSAVLSHRQMAAIHTEEATHPKQLQKQGHMCIAHVCDCHVCFTHPLEKLFARRPSPIATSWAHSRRPGSTVLRTEVTLCTCSFRMKLEQAQR